MPKGAPSELRPRRYQLFLPLKVWIRSWGKGKQSQNPEADVEEETVTENISSAGCYFLLSEEPKVGSRVDMEVQMAPKPGGKPNSRMICRGRVVRVQKGKGSSKTGVGCAIDRYRILPSARKS
jgi:hypothetical protein